MNLKWSMSNTSFLTSLTPGRVPLETHSRAYADDRSIPKLIASQQAMEDLARITLEFRLLQRQQSEAPQTDVDRNIKSSVSSSLAQIDAFNHYLQSRSHPKLTDKPGDTDLVTPRARKVEEI
jgi:hypothetical protein